MTPEFQLKLLGYLEQARQANIGIELEFATADEAKTFRQKLYAVRRDIDDFEGMTFILRNNVLMIVKGQPDE